MPPQEQKYHALDNLIDRCIARNKQPKNAHKTRLTRDRYSIYYASRDGKLQTAAPRDFEKARLGILPIAHHGFPIEQYAAAAGKDWQTRYGFNDWQLASWKQSYGVQVYTGTPSDNLTDFDFEFAIVHDHPDILLDTLSALLHLTPNPCLTLSKSGGLRFSCKTPSYVHPRATENREYIGKWNQQTGEREALYLEIFGDKGLSRWDARYEIITGNLFDLPVIEDIDALFDIIDTLKSKIHAQAPPKKKKSQHTAQSQSPNKKTRTPDDTKFVDGLPNDLQWIPTGEVDKYKSRRGDYTCQVTTHTKSHGAAQYYKDTQTSGISGFCHNCRELWWIHKPTFTAKTIKLHKSDHRLTLETLQRSRAFLTEVFKKNTKVFGLRADTGVGKNEEAIQHVYRGIKLLLNLPHKNLMRELETRFEKAEIPPFAYRGILSNPDGAFPYESPCIQPLRFDTYARKGGNPQEVICSRCPVRGTCEKAGHWHDLGQLQKHQVNLFTFPQLFTNPIFRHWIQSNIGSLEKEDLILHDDTEITSLFNIIEVRREYLENLSRQHTSTNTGSFADILLSILHKDNLYQNVHKFIEGLSDTERDEITDGLSHVRIDGQLLSLDDAIEHGHFKIDTQSDLDALPQVADREWNLVTQLELFFDMYPNTANAPIRYSDGVLSFALAPILPKTNARIGFMGATLQEEHLKRAFPEAYYPNVLFFDATSTEWHPEARVYQLATNRNPRRTVLTDNKLNATGEKYWQSVLDIVSRLGGQHGIITYKSVIEEKQTYIETHGLTTAHFGALTGLDDRFDGVDNLHILFSPERPPFAHQWDTKMIYGADKEKISFDDRDETGTFIDKRAQSVYDAGVIAELIQATGRARLVSKGKKVFLWCSHHLPTITDRAQTFLFTERDIQQWTDTATTTLEKIITDRQQADTEIAAAEQAGDTQILQEITGISERTARRKTEQTRHQSKTKKKARAKLLFEQGVPTEKICAELNIKSRKTFYNWKEKDFR